MSKLIAVGEHECVTCERCACTFALVHPACPRCSSQARLDAAVEALRAVQPYVMVPSDTWPQHYEALGLARRKMEAVLAEQEKEQRPE